MTPSPASWGVGLVALAILSAMRVLVVSRSSRDRVARLVFLVNRKVFDWAWRSSSYSQIDMLMAWYAPSGLLVLVVIWLALVLAGYTGIFLLLAGDGLRDALILSGSSLLTLGFASPVADTPTTAVFLHRGCHRADPNRSFDRLLSRHIQRFLSP